MKAFLVMVAVTFGINAAYAGAGQNKERALIAYMYVKAGTQKQFLKEAEEVIQKSREEVGNITYQLHQSVSDPQQFVFYELFETDADLQFHRNAPHTKAFLARTKPITEKFTLEEHAPVGELQ